MRAVSGVGAVIGLGLLLRRTLGDRQQRSDALDVAGSHCAGEQELIADAVKTARQHVHEKPSDELAGVERHGVAPVAFLDPVIFPFEGDAPVVERDKPSVRDGDAMGVARQIGEHSLRPGEGPLGIARQFG